MFIKLNNLSKIRSCLLKEFFVVKAYSIFFNPFFIIRNGLHKNILSLSHEIDGYVLDFGCGSKPYQSLFSHVKKYIGVDVYVSGHNHSSSQVDFFYNGEKLDFCSETFDSVISFEVFEHVFNIDSILSELNRVLKLKGRILLSIPFAWDEHEIPYDFARYTSFGIRHLLERNGFLILKLIKSNTYFLTIVQLFTAYLFQYIFPKNPIKYLLTFIIIAPIHIVAYIINFLLPFNQSLFSNTIVLAEKTKLDEN